MKSNNRCSVSYNVGIWFAAVCLLAAPTRAIWAEQPEGPQRPTTAQCKETCKQCFANCKNKYGNSPGLEGCNLQCNLDFIDCSGLATDSVGAGKPGQTPPPRATPPPDSNVTPTPNPLKHKPMPRPARTSAWPSATAGRPPLTSKLKATPSPTPTPKSRISHSTDHHH